MLHLITVIKAIVSSVGFDWRLTMQSVLSQLIQTILDPASVWSVVARGAVWLVIALVIIISVDSPNPDQSFRRMKNNLGFLILFIALSAALMYLLFGYTKSA